MEMSHRNYQLDRLCHPLLLTRIAYCFWCFLAVSCAFSQHAPMRMSVEANLDEDGKFRSFDTCEFSSKKWMPLNGAEPQLVVVGVHGLTGAAEDWKVLGETLQKEKAALALYAYDLRGQGRDPVLERRGDIDSPCDWVKDLCVFTELVRKKHPKAKLVWFGESLGALIVMKAVESTYGCRPYDAIALSAPIPSYRGKLNMYQRWLLRAAAWVSPDYRIVLDQLPSAQQIKVVSYMEHNIQLNPNPWHVPTQSLRMINVILNQIEKMNHRASQLEVPSLVLNGGRDIFVQAELVREFVDRIPVKGSVTHHYYEDGYHLLFYDSIGQRVSRDATNWLKGLIHQK